MRRRVSLASELMTVREAVRAVRLLVDPLVMLPMRGCFVPRGLPSSVVAGLTLIEERLRQVDRAIRGAVDPESIVTHDNDADDVETDGDDVLLSSWSPKRAAKHARGELQRARRMLAAERQRKRTGGDAR